MRIVIADDNLAVRRGVAQLLTREGIWEVCGHASNGPEALEKARELRPDLVLLDIRMPGMDGLETARVLGQELPETKIVIMSQRDAGQLLSRVLEAGAHAFVDKSRLATDLPVTIKRLFNKL
jgi:DNA-binding NarL/FixJ family response regulator